MIDVNTDSQQPQNLQDDGYAMTTIDLLRHGECEGGHCYRGSIDLPLTAQGWQQMTCAIDRFCVDQNYPQWQQLVSSPLQRCAAFAKYLAEQRKIPCVLQQNLQEMHFGRWEGKSIESVWQQDRQAVDAWATDPVANPPPEGEAADIFSQRVIAALRAVLMAYQGQHLLCVVHGGVIRALLAYILKMPLQVMMAIHVPYACCTQIQVSSGEGQHFYRLMKHNF